MKLTSFQHNHLDIHLIQQTHKYADVYPVHGIYMQCNYLTKLSAEYCNIVFLNHSSG